MVESSRSIAPPGGAPTLGEPTATSRLTGRPGTEYILEFLRLSGYPDAAKAGALMAVAQF